MESEINTFFNLKATILRFCYFIVVLGLFVFSVFQRYHGLYWNKIL
jgi:hypothetical protein